MKIGDHISEKVAGQNNIKGKVFFWVFSKYFKIELIRIDFNFIYQIYYKFKVINKHILKIWHSSYVINCWTKHIIFDKTKRRQNINEIQIYFCILRLCKRMQHKYNK